MSINSDIENILKEHMENQPFEILCSVCGNSLTLSTNNVDKDMDLTITVEPCSVCLEEAQEEARQEMK